MSWTRTVLELTEPGPDYPETPALARRKLLRLDETSWTSLRSAKAEAVLDKVKLTLVQHPDLHDYLVEDEAPVPGDYEVRIAKTNIPGMLRFLDFEAAKAAAMGIPEEFESASVLRLADIADPISGPMGIVIAPWAGEVPSLPAHELGQPVRIVRDYAKSKVVPSNLTTWMMPDRPTQPTLHPFFGALASQRLAICLASAIEGEPLRLVARLEGKVKARSDVEAADAAIWNDPHLYQVLNEACLWIYGEPKEASNKHALLTGEIARGWPDQSWGAGLHDALEDALVSAQVAYRLHLQEKGIDALKLMGDLRKGVAEDVRGVSTQISAMSASLWRDAAVALGTVALRTTGTVTDWVTFVVAIYLTVGGYLTLRWADQSVAAIADNELAFRRALYRPLLTNKTYNDLALTRYEAVFLEFRTFWRSVAVVYLVAIFGVLGTIGVPLFLADAGNSLTFVTGVIRQWDQLISSWSHRAA